jgi:serine/threonine-protein kinase
VALQPAKLTDFKMTGPLGSGTTAKVYDAVHITTGRSVAIKMLEPSQSGTETRERFAREAILLAGVTSRHVGTIVGFGFDRGQPFLVLERLVGETLDAKLRRDGPVAPPAAVRWIEQLIMGVRDCHDQQIIHRDIKPSNIFLHQEGLEETVKLIDFGVARLREVTGDDGGLTSTHHLIGSMGYMAPEQFQDATTVDFTADLYAVGVCIFRTLTGRLPFVSRSLEAVIKMKAEQSAPALSSMPGMPKNVLLDWFVKKSLARRPTDRFQSAREMLEQWGNVIASLDGARSTTGAGMGGMAVDEDVTLRRVAPVTSSLQAAAVLGPPTGELTVLDVADPADASPNTEPSPSLANQGPQDSETVLDDPFDLPTRSDPNLRKIVERELELHRKRKGEPR